ncbi:hypothetical protein EG329_004992 [Mollisiaceae sp. DMI_Dod_QoI]|nr:hypothetical protein EG329_004992 [Helotiales sp. DMI_Dod_QoI]
MSTSLYIRTYILRFLQTLGRYCDLYLSTPLPRGPAFTRRIKSTVGDSPGEFELLFYTPPGYEKLGKEEKLPLLVNFHGGGYTIGNAADDARFITTIQRRTPCLAVSISYRLAPSHPFPIGITDCVTSLLYLWSHSTELSIDPSLTILTGFSAGGQFCYTSSYLLHSELSKSTSIQIPNPNPNPTPLPQNSKEKESQAPGKIVGICTFYAPTNWTLTRLERAQSNPLTQPLSSLPGLFFPLFETAYFHPYAPSSLDFSSPLLSPGLAPDELVREALPENLCLMTCEWDSLLVEGEVFRERLRGLGKRVEGYVVRGVPHGWDKWPSWWWGGGDRRRDEAYKFVGERVREFWGVG